MGGLTRSGRSAGTAPKAEKAGTRTSPRTKRSDGFTLVELLVVVAIIALVTVFAVPAISGYFRTSLNAAARQLASISREAYNAAVITGRIHRMAYDLEARNYWVESGSPDTLLHTEASLRKEEERRRYSNEEPPPPPFALDESITRGKKALPSGVRFTDVVSGQSDEPLTEGVAYTHFFPNGLGEMTIVHIENAQNLQFSLVISPIGGKVRLLQERVEAKDVFGD